MTEARGPESLDYRDGRLDRPDRRWFWIEFVGGFVVGCTAIAVNGANLVLSNVHYTSATQPSPWQTNQFNWIGPLNCSVISLAVVAVAVFFSMRRGHRPFALGALTGVGITLLVEGLCFVGNWG